MIGRNNQLTPMKTSITNCNLRAFARFTKSAFNAALLSAVLWLFPLEQSHAGSASWQAAPTRGDWNTAANWTPNTVPNSPSDTATFGSSNITNVSTSALIQLDGIVFNPGASAFTITDSALPDPNEQLVITGVGITNNSGITQNFVIAGDDGSGNGGLTAFAGTSTAGNLTVFTCNGATALVTGSGGTLQFNQASSATNSTFVNNGATVFNGSGGSTQWTSTGSPGSSTFINNGGTVGGANGGATSFSSGGSTGNATLIANGGSNGGNGGVIIIGAPNVGTSRVEGFGNGFFELDNGPATVSVGSIERKRSC
jgi:hypothetical protein